jgi:hypothetical protein
MTTATDTPSLKAALKFTDDDLAANRAGQLSAAQRSRLLASRQRALWIGVGVLVVVVLLATTTLYIGQVNRDPLFSFIGIAITICSAVISGVLIRNWYRLSADVSAGTVETLAGTVQHTVRVTGRSATYLFKVGEQVLTVPKPVFLSVRNGGRYRFYRTPVSRLLLSGEPDA